MLNISKFKTPSTKRNTNRQPADSPALTIKIQAIDKLRINLSIAFCILSM